jgi:hypothetical protein
MNKVLSTVQVPCAKQDGGFLQSNTAFSTNKSDRNNVTEILLKVALNIINPFVEM